jgi:hypothetical protein
MAKSVNKTYLSIKSMFEQGNVRQMRDLEQLFPTSLSKDLNMNHGRYIERLHNPEKFSFNQIFKFASLINVDPKIVSDVIISELKKKYKMMK